MRSPRVRRRLTWPGDPVFFFRTKTTKSGNYLQLVKTEGGHYSDGPKRKQTVAVSFGRLDHDVVVRLKDSLDRIAEKVGVTRYG